MKKLLYAVAVVSVLFVATPVVYMVGSMFIDVWRDMLPYEWTHSPSGHVGGHGRHHYR